MASSEGATTITSEAPAALWVAATQAALQAPGDALVDKPRLTDKLLAKPPFRFLHDVVSAVRACCASAALQWMGTGLHPYHLALTSHHGWTRHATPHDTPTAGAGQDWLRARPVQRA
jgi:hypothetical protein